jgi:uncharacterized protein (DUF1810 family)
MMVIVCYIFPIFHLEKTIMAGLHRFHDAQQGRNSGLPSFNQAYAEIQQGSKKSHWIWYILPQFKNLGASQLAQKYAIQNAQEACDYLREPKLFDNYYKIVTKILLQIQHTSIHHVMGSSIDAQKLMSSLTLFKEIAEYLDAQQKGQFHDYKDLAKKCEQILASGANELLFPCEKTLSLVKPQIARLQPISSLQRTLPIVTSETLQKGIIDSQSPSLSTTSTLFSPLNKTTIYNPEPSKVEKKPNSELIKDLKKYIAMRNEEWSFHYNFLGVMSVLYFLHDAVLGTDFFNNKSKEIKLNAATKLETWLDSSDSNELELTAAEYQALQQGRLGALITKHGGINLHKESTIPASQEPRIRFK